MVSSIKITRTPITRSRSLNIAKKEEELRKALSDIGAKIAAKGEACVIVKLEYKSSSGKVITEMIPFDLFNNTFFVRYCNFHPYGKQVYFKRHYGQNKELLIIIESYLRSKGATYVE